MTGAGIASSSLMYLALPIIMGLAMRYGKLSVNKATVIFLPLVLALDRLPEFRIECFDGVLEGVHGSPEYALRA